MSDIVLVAIVGFAGIIGTGVLSPLVLGWLNARSRIREKEEDAEDVAIAKAAEWKRQDEVAAKAAAVAEGFNNPNHAAQRYSWIRPPSTSLRSTGVRGVPWTCGVRVPAGTAKLSPRCGLSAT